MRRPFEIRSERKMKDVRHVLTVIGGWLGRVLTTEIFPEDMARVLPVSPIPPVVRLHREGEGHPSQ
jgi:hypothetical protein